MSLSRVYRSAFSLATRASVRSTGLVARAFSGKVDINSDEDITKYFLDMDAKAPKSAATALPFKLTGQSGEIVTDLYVNAGKDKNFDKIVADLQGFVAAVESSGLVVDRFFQTSSYSSEECNKVLDILFTNKEPLTSYSGIKDAEVREVIIDNEANLDTWKGARKAVQALNVSNAVKNVLTDLANSGKLNLIKPVATKAAEVRSITSKTADVVVTSAVALTKAQQDAISKALPNYTSGQNVSVTYSVDPAVLGGLLITIGNKTIDLSSTSKLVDVLA